MRQWFWSAIAWALLTTGTSAQDGLIERPILTIDPAMHTAPIQSAGVDRDGQWAVTGADDKTVRVWSLGDGDLVQTIRLPRGPGHVGKVYAVAITPDGSLVAAGGRTRGIRGQEQIYLFNRETGTMNRRIAGLDSEVLALAFSSDGRYLAATLAGAHGLRVYDRDAGWAERARDADYGASSDDVAFARDGRLATVSSDGRLRLYDAAFQRTHRTEVPDPRRPRSVAFSPDGTRLAVAYRHGAQIDLMDAGTLAPRATTDTTGIEAYTLSHVAWSGDGATLFAAGRHRDSAGRSTVFAWADGGDGDRRRLADVGDGVSALVPVTGGGILAAGAAPSLAMLRADGTTRWTRRTPRAGLKLRGAAVAVSANGRTVDVMPADPEQPSARFNVDTLKLTRDPPDDGVTVAGARDGLAVSGWDDGYDVRLADKRLPLNQFEMSRSLAVHPDGRRFVLGTDLALRAFDASGDLLWRRPTPGPAWSIAISADGHLAVVAYADGTVRWHDMADGQELLAFSAMDDLGDWVAWTPQGFYAASPGARQLLRWHVNHGWDRAPANVSLHEIPGTSRPDVLPLVLQARDIARALGLAELQAHRQRVRHATGVAPGTRLHVLTVGVSEYGAHAPHLRLKYAHQDAKDLTRAVAETQGSLYTLKQQQLLNEEATEVTIRRALRRMAEDMREGDGDDLAVVLFSGHGAWIDGAHYLFPHGVDDGNADSLAASAMPVLALREKVQDMARYGKVLLLLDACRSGAATADGTPLQLAPSALVGQLATRNIAVLTSSSADAPSYEDHRWQNGAFTEVLLQALRSPADSDRNGLISVTELTNHLALYLPSLTADKPEVQRPGIEVNYSDNLFVAGL